MAQYQIGNEVYELPDNLSPDKLNEIIQSLAGGGQSQPDDSLTTGIANRALGIAAGATDFLPTVTKAVTGVENPRIFVPRGDGPLGVDLSNIEILDASDPKLKGATNPLGFEGNEFEKAADALYEKQKSLNYQPKIPWNEVKSNPSAGNILGFMGEAAVTSLPDMGAALLSAPAYFASYVAPIAQKRAENDGRTEVTPADLAYAAAASAGIATAERVGAKAVFTKGAGNAVTRPLKAGGKEATTEAIQNPLQYAAETAGTETGFDAAEAADQSLAGFVGGAGAGTGIRTTLDATGAVTGGVKRVFNPADNSVVDPEAASELAQRLDGIATANEYDLNDIDKMSTTGARETVDKAHVQLAEELKQVAKDLKSRLQITESDELSTVIDKVLAQAGQREARNKTKNTVGVQEMDAITDLTGDTAEGQRMLSIVRQLNELTELHNSGYQGGLSRITDQFMPFGTSVGYDRGAVATERLLRPIVSGGAAIQTGGASLAGQAALAGAGRAVDAVTGRRSRVRRFIEQNKANQGIQQQEDLPSLRTQAQEQTRATEAAELATQANEAALNRELAQRNAPPVPTSPQGTVEDATGLDRNGVARIIRILERTSPKLKNAIEDYRTTVDTGGTVRNMNQLIRAINGLADSDQRLGALRVREPNRNTQQQQTRGAESANYQRGIQSNIEFAQDLMNRVEQDNSMNLFDKDVAVTALRELSQNLGSEPKKNAEAIAKKASVKARNKSKVSEYVDPYVERVVRQQKSAKKSEGIEQVSEMAMFDPINLDTHDINTPFYHGTASVFKEFDADMMGKETGANSAKKAFWFVDDPQTAQSYATYAAIDAPVGRLMKQAEEQERNSDFGMSQGLMRQAEELEQRLLQEPETQGQSIIPVYLPKNLYEIDARNGSYMDSRDEIGDALEYAKENGFAGIRVSNLSDTADYSNFRPATHIAIFDPADVRSMFSTLEQTEKSQKPFEPFLTEELMERPLTEREIQFNEMEKGIYELRNQLDRMRMRAGEGVLSNRKKSSDIGNMQLDFDPRKVSQYRKRIIEKAVESLDPEGRKLISELQVGLDGDGGITNEQIAILVPSVVRSIEFMTGKQADQREAYGRYGKILSPQGNLMRNRIEVTDIKETLSEGPVLMHADRFLDVLLHEVGHAIGDRSNLDQLVSDTVSLGKLDPDESYYTIMNQLSKVSKQRRPDTWETLDKNLQMLQQRTGYYLGPALQSYQLKVDRDGDVEELSHEVHKRAIAEGQLLVLDQIPDAVRRIANQVRYLNSPKELVADAVAYYLQKPKQMKEYYPELAKVIRKGVNDSDLQQFITFHSLAGLLGAAGLMAAVQAAMTGGEDEEQGIFSFGQGALST